MAVIWCAVLAVAVRVKGNATLIGWIELMAQAGMVVNVVLAVFNLLPVPPLDGGRVLAGLLPVAWGKRLDKLEPIGLFLVLGLSIVHGLDWAFEPAFRAIGRVFTVVVGSSA
jgi:Zn-dependent protease